MSGQGDHPHVPDGNFTPHRPIPTLPEDTDRFIDQLLASPPHQPALHGMDFDSASPNSLPAPVHHPQPRMELTEERFLALQALAEKQAKQIEM